MGLLRKNKYLMELIKVVLGPEVTIETHWLEDELSCVHLTRLHRGVTVGDVPYTDMHLYRGAHLCTDCDRRVKLAQKAVIPIHIRRPGGDECA